MKQVYNDQRTQFDSVQNWLYDAVENLEDKLKGTGWKKVSVGQSARVNYNDQFILYNRTRRLIDCFRSFGDKTNLSPIDITKNADKLSQKSMVSQSSMGQSVTYLTPCHLCVDDFHLSSDITLLSKPPSDMSLVYSHSKVPCTILSGTNSYNPLHPFHNIHDSIGPLLPNYDAFPSLQFLRSDKSSLVISYHCSYYYQYCSGTLYREIFGWYFSVVPDESHDDFIEYAFIRKNGDSVLSLDLALGRILDDLDVNPVDIRKTYRYISMGELDSSTGERVEHAYRTADEAIENALETYPNGRLYRIERSWEDIKYNQVTLLCHAGNSDLSGFAYINNYSEYVLSKCSNVQGGIISTRPITIYPRTVDYAMTKGRHVYSYPIALTISDTICHAPADKKCISDLASVVGINTSLFERINPSDLHHLLKEDPVCFFERAAIRNLIPLLYAGLLYGFNRKLPMTITSRSAAMIKRSIKEYLGCRSEREYETVFRGLKSIPKGLRKNEDDHLVPAISKEAISLDAADVWNLFKSAYHGGYNSAPVIGYYPIDTFDYDLQNAYPTAMCLVADIDWKNPIEKRIKDRMITIDDFKDSLSGEINPFLPMAANVQFSFPKDCLYPCIPTAYDGSIVFTLNTKDDTFISAAGPEIYLALKLGAKVTCRDGMVLRRLAKDGQVSCSIRHAVRQLVADRAKAKKLFGKGSLPDLILKTIVNAGYGKTAQQLIQKDCWDEYLGNMRNMDCSTITNPVIACMTTSIIRALLLAAQNQLHQLKYTVYSLTTDGFISNAPQSILKQLDLYDMHQIVAKARLFLTGGKSPELWEIKHQQNDLLNFTTRGNVSLNTGEVPYGASLRETEQYSNPIFTLPGVCAHANAKGPFIPDSFEDRLWLFQSVISRTGPILSFFEEYTSFKELAKGETFRRNIISRNMNMDFDMKRKPLRASFHQMFIPIKEESYEFMNFETEAFETIEEYVRYRSVRNAVSCLRTQQDWDAFFLKIDAKEDDTSSIMHITSSQWTILQNCIAGHRAGLWIIPKLNELSGANRNEWISKHSPRPYTSNDWKNAGRSTRQRNLLPKEILSDKLSELQSDT